MLKYLKLFIISLSLNLIINIILANQLKTADYYRTNEIDFKLYQISSLISQGKIEKSIKSLEDMLILYPNFELVLNMYQDIRKNYYGVNSTNKKLQPNIKEELIARFNFLENENLINKYPEDIIHIDTIYRYAILVDLEKNRFYLIKNDKGIPQIYKTYYSTIGENGFPKLIEGDKKTPVGIYFINKYIPHNTLDYSIYGREGGLSIDYPNKIDKLENKTGYGIWIHGSPSGSFSRPPKSSLGCVSIEDHNLAELKSIINQYKVPVILNPNLKWISKQQWLENRDKFIVRHKLWKYSQENDRYQYLTYYHSNYMHRDKTNLYHYANSVIKNKKLEYSINLDQLIILKDNSRDLILSVFNIQEKSKNKELRVYWKKNKNNEYKIFAKEIKNLYQLSIKNKLFKLASSK